MLNPTLSRIVLGTVQLGLPYGRRRSRPALTEAETSTILDAAWDIGIRAFDTAEGYGSAAPRLAEWLRARGRRGSAHVVTKVKPMALERFDAAATAAVQRYSGCASVTALSHGTCGVPFWNVLISVADRLGATPGQSVYGDAEVDSAARCARIGRIQAPANVFDRSALSARGDRSVPLDLRSIYLQGVLLDEPEAAEQRVPGGAVLANAVRRAAAAAEYDAAALLAASMLRAAGPRDRIVVGVDRVEELAALLDAASVPESSLAEFERVLVGLVAGPVPSSVLDPRRW
jgi:aryl-alcohol dehydrogenase-like predicted oxidoreductase